MAPSCCFLVCCWHHQRRCTWAVPICKWGCPLHSLKAQAPAVLGWSFPCTWVKFQVLGSANDPGRALVLVDVAEHSFLDDVGHTQQCLYASKRKTCNSKTTKIIKQRNNRKTCVNCNLPLYKYLMGASLWSAVFSAAFSVTCICLQLQCTIL